MSRKKALEKMERLEDPSKDQVPLVRGFLFSHFQDADSISLRFPDPGLLLFVCVWLE
jgi:hypothetical protein